MLSWLKRWLDRTPHLSTDDLAAPAAAPPPPPPDDLGPEHLADLATFVPGARGHVLTEDTEQVRAVSTLVFEHFRAQPDELPTFPALALQIFEILERPRSEVDIDQLVKVLSREPATSALMLRVANSSRYGTSRQLASVRDAVVRMGIQEVSNLAVAAASKSLFDPSQRELHLQFGPFWSDRWRHALTTAFSASWLSMETRVGQPQEAFLAGLLHDVGKSLALRVLTELVITGAWTTRLADPVIERVLETTHVDIGSEAAIMWGLPSFVVEVCQEQRSESAQGLPLVVQLASDVYQVQYNPLHQPGLGESIVQAANELDVNARLFKELTAQTTTFASVADDIAVDATHRSAG